MRRSGSKNYREQSLEEQEPPYYFLQKSFLAMTKSSSHDKEEEDDEHEDHEQHGQHGHRHDHDNPLVEGVLGITHLGAGAAHLGVGMAEGGLNLGGKLFGLDLHLGEERHIRPLVSYVIRTINMLSAVGSAGTRRQAGVVVGEGGL